MEEKKSTALAVAQPQSLGVTGGMRLSGLADIERLAHILADAPGMTPTKLLGKPFSIVASILTGMELGMGPMESMRSIHSIDGKPTLSSELMLARARRAGAKTFWVKDGRDGVATLSIIAPGDTREQTFSYTADEAKEAGLLGKDNWKKSRAAMLRARAASAAIRAACPEVLGASGIYEADSGELTDGMPSGEYIDASVTVAQPKSVQDIAIRGVEPPTQKANLADCTTGAELHDMLTRGAEKMAASTGAARQRYTAAVKKHAARLGVDELAALEVAGLGEKPAEHVTDDGEVLPPEETA